MDPGGSPGIASRFPELGENIVERSVLGRESRQRIAQQTVGDLETKRAIALELRLAEELIDRSFVREFRVGDRIAADSGILHTVVAGLDVEDQAVLAVAVGGPVTDLADRMIGMRRAD